MAEWVEDENTFTVEVGLNQHTVTNEVTKSDIKEITQEEGVGKFKVRDEDSEGLNQADFPVEQDVKVEEYNENASE